MAWIEFDHLVIAAATLDEGIGYVRTHYGVDIRPGGKHDVMATQNAVGRIGPDTYLEVIAIDQDAPPPTRRRWFSLDDPVNRRRLERDGPRIAHWVCRTDSLTDIVHQCSCDMGRILSLTRRAIWPGRWRCAMMACCSRTGCFQPSFNGTARIRHAVWPISACGCGHWSCAIRSRNRFVALLATIGADGLVPGAANG